MKKLIIILSDAEAYTLLKHEASEEWYKRLIKYIKKHAKDLIREEVS